MDQSHLLDPHLYKVISKCLINKKRRDCNEISVAYDDGARETIWTYDPSRYDFSYEDFVGKTKIEAVFYCDRKNSRNLHAVL